MKEETDKFNTAKGVNFMSVSLGYGKYVFGEDIPVGKYDIDWVEGSDSITVQKPLGSHSKAPEVRYLWISEERNHYHGLSLSEGWFFEVPFGLKVRLSKSEPIKFE